MTPTPGHDPDRPLAALLALVVPVLIYGAVLALALGAAALLTGTR